MKKLYVLLLATPLVLAGCKKEDESCNGFDNECRLAATWSGEKITIESDGMIPIKSTGVVYEDALLDEITFYSDGTYEALCVDEDGYCWTFERGPGSWYYQDGVIYMDGWEYTLESLTASKLILSREESGRDRKTTGPSPEETKYTFEFSLNENGPTEIPD